MRATTFISAAAIAGLVAASPAPNAAPQQLDFAQLAAAPAVPSGPTGPALEQEAAVNTKVQLPAAAATGLSKRAESWLVCFLSGKCSDAAYPGLAKSSTTKATQKKTTSTKATPKKTTSTKATQKKTTSTKPPQYSAHRYPNGQVYTVKVTTKTTVSKRPTPSVHRYSDGQVYKVRTTKKSTKTSKPTPTAHVYSNGQVYRPVTTRHTTKAVRKPTWKPIQKHSTKQTTKKQTTKKQTTKKQSSKKQAPKTSIKVVKTSKISFASPIMRHTTTTGKPVSPINRHTTFSVYRSIAPVVPGQKHQMSSVSTSVNLPATTASHTTEITTSSYSAASATLSSDSSSQATLESSYEASTSTVASSTADASTTASPTTDASTSTSIITSTTVSASTSASVITSDVTVATSSSSTESQSTSSTPTSDVTTSSSISTSLSTSSTSAISASTVSSSTTSSITSSNDVTTSTSLTTTSKAATTTTTSDMTTTTNVIKTTTTLSTSELSSSSSTSSTMDSTTGTSTTTFTTTSTSAETTPLPTTTTTTTNVMTSTTSSQQACITNPEEGTYCGFINPEDPCAPQPGGHGPAVTPDTVDAFKAYEPFHTLASAAPASIASKEQGAVYKQVFRDLDGAVSAASYLGLHTLKAYDVAECRDICDKTALCTAFNIYIERDPSQSPSANDSTAPTVYGYWCPNPKSITNFKCTLWGSSINAGHATNKGQMQHEFQVVIAGSNGYDKTATSTPVCDLPVINPGQSSSTTSAVSTSTIGSTTTMSTVVKTTVAAMSTSSFASTMSTSTRRTLPTSSPKPEGNDSDDDDNDKNHDSKYDGSKIPKWSAGKDCGDKAVDSPATHLGRQFFSGPYNPQLCADYAWATTASSKAAAVGAGKSDFVAVKFFNAYYLLKNGKPFGTVCNLYSAVAADSKLTFTGSSDGNTKYTTSQSWTFELETDGSFEKIDDVETSGMSAEDVIKKMMGN